MEMEAERDVVRWGHTRHALHIWAVVKTVPRPSPMPLSHNQLSFPQKLALPAPLGTRKRSLLSLQIHEPVLQKYAQSAMRWKTLLKSWTQAAAQELLSRNWTKLPLPQTSPNCLTPGLSLQGRQVHKVTTPVPPHCQGNRRTNKSLWGETAASAGCKPRCT